MYFLKINAAIFLLQFFAFSVSGQAVGIGTNTPHPSSALEVKSTNKGLLLPRLNDTLSIANPAKGLTIYNTGNNKIWFYNGNSWQQTSSNAGGMDSLWYKTQDSISYSAKKFVGINTDPLFMRPQAELQVNGSLLVQAPQLYSRSAPTAAQTYVMDNISNATLVPETDSVFRVFDPGGVNNYINNSQGNIYAKKDLRRNQDGFKIKFNPKDFGLAVGDTLWISDFGYPECRNNFFFRLTNTELVPREIIYTEAELFFTFRSNNTFTAKGFDITVNRVYTASEDASGISTSGSVFCFSNGSLIAGYNVKALGRNSFALGNGAKAIGTPSIALGSATASGKQSVAIGDDAFAGGGQSLALNGGKTTGDYSFSSGIKSIASGQHSMALGAGTTSKAFGGVSLGFLNDTLDAPNPNRQAATDRIFQVGNGNLLTSTWSNALTVLLNGNTGIGTTTPNAPLQFANTIANRKIVMWETLNTETDFYGFGINSGTLRYNVPPGSNHTFFAGNTALFNLLGNGNAILAGSLTQLSDTRLKKNITHLEGNLHRLTKLSGYTYYWKDGARDSDEQIGLLAQEVQALFPQLVRRDKEGLLSVNYNGLIPVLIESVKELNKMLELQQKEIEQIKALLKK